MRGRFLSAASILVLGLGLSACGGGGGGSGGPRSGDGSLGVCSGDSCTQIWNLQNGFALPSTLAYTTFRVSGQGQGPRSPTVSGLSNSNHIGIYSNGDRALRAEVTSPISPFGVATYLSRVGPSIDTDTIPETSRNRLDSEVVLYTTRNERVSGGVSTVILYDPSSTTNRLDYTTFGAWVFENRVNENDPNTTFFTAGAQAAGIQTAPGSMPGSGSATFGGRTVGTYVNATGVQGHFSGAASVTANFGSRSVVGSFSDLTLHQNTGTLGTTLPTVTFNGAISGNSYTGATQSGQSTGSVRGSFFGTRASETGGSWTLEGGGAAMVGAFGASR